MMVNHIVTSSLNTEGKRRSIAHPQPAWKAPTMSHEAATSTLIGDRKDRLYIVRGEPMYTESGWISTSEEERETERARSVQFPEEEGDSLLSTGRVIRKAQSGRTSTDHSSAFKFVYRQRKISFGQRQEQEGVPPDNPGKDTEIDQRTSLVKRECWNFVTQSVLVIILCLYDRPSYCSLGKEIFLL